MVLEALMGWSQAQIVDDYMKSYDNYYGILPGAAKYDLIVEKNIQEMLCFVAGLDPKAPAAHQSGAFLAETDLKAAAEAYLLHHGMDEEALKQLEVKLASE
jgi:hypothetical protein